MLTFQHTLMTSHLQELRFPKFTAKMISLQSFNACSPWSHGLRPKTPIRVPSQRPLAPSVTPVTSVANVKGDNEKIPGLCADLLALPYS